jgi:hypothetical protein
MKAATEMLSGWHGGSIDLSLGSAMPDCQSRRFWFDVFFGFSVVVVAFLMDSAGSNFAILVAEKSAWWIYVRI